MNTLGLIGGIGPESTIDYYRQIIAAYRLRRPDGSQPPMLIDSLNLKEMIGLVAAGKLAELATFLVGELHRLARAGSGCAGWVCLGPASRCRGGSTRTCSRVILGGTELPLLLKDAGDEGAPFLDTTAIHVARITDEILS